MNPFSDIVVLGEASKETLASGGFTTDDNNPGDCTRAGGSNPTNC